MKKRAAFFSDDPAAVARVYGAGRMEEVARRTRLDPRVPVTSRTFQEHLPALRDVQVIFATWGFRPLRPDQLDAMPSLEAVFYAAGSVRAFAAPLLERNILLVSARAANAVPVAEFTLAQILLSMKGYFRNSEDCRDPRKRIEGRCAVGPGIFGEKVAVLGLGAVGRKLVELLRPFDLEILGCDPRLDEPEAVRLGIRRVGLQEAFREAFVVSNHTPDLESTRGMLDGSLFESMRPGAVFINTGRGAQVVEADLVEVLRRRPDLTALLDVTDPEPPPPGSPLYRLPNVRLSSHIAGSVGNEVVRMADFALEEYDAWIAGRPLRRRVTPEMLHWMA